MSESIDLVVLVADGDIEQTIRGLLSRPQDLNINEINFEIYKHPNHDGGCRTDGHNLLRPFHSKARFALNIFDHDGSGREKSPVTEVEEEARSLLAKNGWGVRAETIVIEPEIEQWIWSDSPVVLRIMGWERLTPTLRQWLTEHGYYSSAEQTKPQQPKEAFRAALRESNKKPSASLFRQMAERVQFDSCSDRSFNKLKNTLQNWFSEKSGATEL
ncbi:MAG TPA: hypothetical protein VLA12_19525 [Planctomycetaceae bacterium]|nr:hypothetical protein [Planctomycetaceae bacterium]